jgi:hypothetical protein
MGGRHARSRGWSAGERQDGVEGKVLTGNHGRGGEVLAGNHGDRARLGHRQAESPPAKFTGDSLHHN